VVFDAVWGGPEEEGWEVLVQHDWVVFSSMARSLGRVWMLLWTTWYGGAVAGSQVKSRAKVVSLSCDSSMCPGRHKEEEGSRKISSMTGSRGV
jgi:hypothetical protein